MAIFNSYVSLPEGIMYLTIKVAGGLKDMNVIPFQQKTSLDSDGRS
jgi:hypothetical protein